MKMKKTALFLFSLFVIGCSTNPDYERNLANAKKLFELHGAEDLEGQKKLVSKEIKSVLPMYGSEPVDYENYVQMLQGYHDAFEDIKYTANVWLPGTDENGNPNGSVRTYGNWTGVNVVTGKKLNLNGYWYFDFDAEGLIIEQGDFFDVGGMVAAVYDVNHPDEIINVVNMTINNKTLAEVKTFTEFYTEAVNRLEPNSLSFKFTNTGRNKITLIERYKNSDALLKHASNVSPGDELEEAFKNFQAHFTINYMTLYGDSSKELKETIKAFKLKANYIPVIAGYSR